MCNNFFSYLHVGGLFPCFSEFSRSSLVSKLQDGEPGKKLLLTVEVLRFRDGNSNILNKRNKDFKLCFLLLPKMFSENEK